MNLHPTSITAGMHRLAKACGVTLALMLGACGGGGDGDVGGAQTPEILTSPFDQRAVVGQTLMYSFEVGSAATMGWEEQLAGTTDWRATTASVAVDGLRSNLIVGPVDIGMDKRRYRGRATNNAGSVTSGEARMDIVWGLTSTLEPNSIDFGPGAGGMSGADGGSPGGGDGEGAGVGGGLGKTPRATISVARVIDGASLGSAQAGATSGLVRVKAGPGAAPFAITLRGNTDATYYDEGRDAMLALPDTEELHALALSFDRHLGVTILTEAAYRYALNHFLQDPDAVRAGTVPLKRTATADELTRLTPAQIQLANEAIRAEINRLLPARYALDSISTLPTPVDNTSPQGSITDNIYGRMQAVVGALSLAAARFEPSLASPALRMNAQLADDLTDGIVDGLSLDQRTVFGATGTNAYGPGSLAGLLEQAADDQFARFGDGTIQAPPVITAQPASAVITEGGSATLSVAATGSLLSFQWFRDGQSIGGATRNDLSVTTSGTYHVVIANAAASVTSASVTVTVVPATIAPSITGQPASTTVTSGDAATFTVQAAGTDLRYQWQLVTPSTADDIPGATSSSFSTTNAGTYRVRITNSAGTVTSEPVTLTVTPRIIAPRITAQPVGTTIVAGQFATLEVAASGNPLAFQWHDAAGPINGATSSSYRTGTAGTYHVVVSNSAGSVASDNVAVNVIVPPTITTHPASVTINQGQTTTLSVSASGSALTYQWLLNGEPIAGAQGPTHATGTAGSYTVTVTNTAGNVTSNAATVTVVGVPSITRHPASITINEGETGTLSVEATGPSLSYQWQRDGANVGTDSASLSVTTAGSYTVIVRNPAGDVTSNAATVTVTARPTITTHPASVTINQGQSTTLSVEASGSGLSYQWQRAGEPIAGATGASYATGTAGAYTVVVSNAAGSVTSNPATVTVVGLPTITTHPASVTINQGQTTTLNVGASGDGTLTYQWRLNGTPIAGANGPNYTTGTAGSYTVVVGNAAGSVTSNPATVNVIGLPSITTHPASVTINHGQTTTLNVGASGDGTLTYQWRLNGTPITGAAGPSYTTGTAGTYTVVVANSAGSITSNPATVTVVVPPSITTHPESVTINQGQTATLRVAATGGGTLAYQWFANGAPIPGATASSYATGTAGTYRVTVSNSAGSQTSNDATVSVVPPPTITTQPASVTINQGQTTTLRVVATGGTLAYQWFGNGAPIAGATASSYTTGAAGTYRVMVSNSAGSQSSSDATVTVIVPPTASVQPTNATILRGQTATLTATATSGTSPFTYQWANANGPITGATASTYATGSPGTYTVTIRNQAGSSTASATVTLIQLILTQPTSATIPAGKQHTFGVQVDSSVRGLQWQVQTKGGWEPIGGATDNVYTTGTAGTYRVTATNGRDTEVSNEATLTVIAPPVITQQPTYLCCPDRYTVTASGSGLTYQWYARTYFSAGYVDTAIPGATSSSLPSALWAYYFYVVIRNDAGAVQSNIVSLLT